jgi:cytochrome oxidase Cu insertion factor (SCO1/SenC/PrrC family)
MTLSPRAKLLLIVAVFVLPMVAAALAYSGWHPRAHANYGELLTVTPLANTEGASQDGGALDLATLRGKWLMVHVGPADCDAHCAQQLYLTRQTRIAQGKEQTRIERVWVLTDSGEVAGELLAQHPGLRVWRPHASGFLAQFPAQSDRDGRIYLIDPLGNLMLRFPPRPDPRRLMKDLRLLLKASQIG